MTINAGTKVTLFVSKDWREGIGGGEGHEPRGGARRQERQIEGNINGAIN